MISASYKKKNQNKSISPNMKEATQFLGIVPVLPSEDISRDVIWYKKHLGLECLFNDGMYAILKRDLLFIHLQWHSGTKEDPVNGGTVIRIFVKKIHPLFQEFVIKGSIDEDKLRLETAWNTNEFGLFDLNNNAIFFVENIDLKI